YDTDGSNLTSVFDNNEQKAKSFNILKSNLRRMDSTSFVHVDGAVIVTEEGGNNGFDGKDAQKFSNPADNIAIVRNNNRNYVIEYRDELTPADTIQLRIWNIAAATPYQLQIDASAFQSPYQAFLWDKLAKQFTPIKNKDIITLNFIPTNDTNTFRSRFAIVFRDQQTLPIKITQVAAQLIPNSQNHAISWTSIGEDTEPNAIYFVQHSSNAINYTDVGSVAASNKSVANYQLVNENTVNGTNYYRIKAVYTNGSIIFSNTVSINQQANHSIAFSIYPSVIQNEQVNIEAKLPTAGEYQWQLVQMDGKVVTNQKLVLLAGTNSQSIQLSNNNLVPGTYIISIVDASGKIIHQQKLIKK
ncbi:MAG: T9SS type A sorting domain-containing protein, partial [Chitinophagaceae bacterium]